MIAADRGRPVLPKEREQANTNVNTRFVVHVKGDIGPINTDKLLLKAQKISLRKLADSREEDHEAAKFLTKPTRST